MSASRGFDEGRMRRRATRSQHHDVVLLRAVFCCTSIPYTVPAFSELQATNPIFYALKLSICVLDHPCGSRCKQ